MLKRILIAAFGYIVIVTSAYAQNAAPANEEGGLEEIVVTAQKREQNLQNVPVAVTALNAQAIANQRIGDFADLVRAAPALTMTQTTSSPNNSIILRGIGTFAFSIGVEPSVAVIVDDMPVVQQAQAFDNLADLQRIEVLKGPQGTLFGKNSSAGVVNIVTQDPGPQTTGSVSATVSTDKDYRLEGVLSTPLSDATGVRLSAFYRSYDGNIKNLVTGRSLNDSENYGLRAKFKSELNDTVTLTLTGAYAKATQAGTVTSIRSITGTGVPRVLGSAALPLLPSLSGINFGKNNLNALVDAEGATSNESSSIAARFNIDLGFANLISVSAYQDWKYTFQNDFDGTGLNVLGALTGGAASGGIAQQGPYHSRNLTQELRLVSGNSEALKYVLGGFYSKATTDRAFTRGPTVAVANWAARNTSESLGLFGQVDYTLPSNTTLSGGVRYNNEKISVAFDNLVPGATANQCAPGNPACRGSNSDNVVTWKGAISQELAPQVMVFASAARGYKGYAYDIVTGFNPARINRALNGTAAGLVGVGPIAPETSDSYELGLKSRFLENRLQLNVVGFQTKYENFQAQSAIIVGTPPAPQFVLNNVGKLKTKGVEVELSAKPSDWMRLDAGLAYTDAVMTSFQNAQGFPGQTGQVWNGSASTLVGPCTSAATATAASPRTTCIFQDRSGARLPNSPKLKWSLGSTMEFSGPGSSNGTFVLNYRQQSAVNFDLLGNPLLQQDAYGVLDSSVAFERGRYKVTLFVNNLFDEHYAAGLSDGFGTYGGSATNDTHVITQFLTRDSERYFGLKATVSF